MSQQTNKNLVARYYDEMWNKWNFALVDELLAKEISFRGSLGTETRGRTAFCNYMRRVQGAFPDFRNEIDEMIAQRNRVFTRLTYTGTHRGEIFGVRKRGEKSVTPAQPSIGLRMARLPKASAISRPACPVGARMLR
jgi:predicted ester cyclase